MRTVVFLHGLLADARLWRKVLPELGDDIEVRADLRAVLRGVAERLAGDFPNARIEWIDDSLTFVPEDRPHELAAILRAAAGSSSQ
jgi:pimeloyl-ACP methyl ester carboxylesterase